MSAAEIEERLRRFQASKAFPRRMIFERHVLPVDEDQDRITLVTSKPNDPPVSAILSYMMQKEIVWVSLDDESIVKLIKENFGIGADTLHAMLDKEEWQESEKDSATDDEDLDEGGATVVRFVSQVISEAYKERATDIHFEPMETSLRIRSSATSLVTSCLK